MAQFGSFEHDRCLWQMKGVRKGAKQGVVRNGNEHNDYVLTVSHVVVRFHITSLIRQKQYNRIYRDVAQFGSFEHDHCLWQMKGVRKGAKQGVMRNGNEQNDYVLTVSHVVVRFHITSLIHQKQYNRIYRDVAQFGRAPRSGRGSRRFESCHLDHKKSRLQLCSRAFL